MNRNGVSHLATTNRNLAAWLPIITVLFIGVCYFFLARDIIFLGDDIGYYTRYVSWKGTWKGIPIAMHQHWEGYNGRMSDMLAPFALNVLGVTGRGVMNAIMAILFFGAPLLLLKFKENRLLYRMLFISLLTFTLRWDSLWMENIATQDYMWPAGFAMLMLAMMLKGKAKSNSWWLWLSLPFCMAAPWMHEALGFPLALGLLVYMIFGGFMQRAGNARRAMAIAFVIGGFMSISSVADFNKFFSSMPTIEREPVWEMLLCSGFYVMALLIATIITAIKRPDVMRKLTHSTWIMWTVAAFVSVCFMIIVGYGRRPGWYAQIFALMALSMMVIEMPVRINDKAELCISAMLLLFIPTHFGSLVHWQHRASKETAEIIQAARKSETGTIFYDYTHDTDLPWFLLRKVHTFPDEDDTYYRMMMKNFYCHGNKITVLPKAAAGINFENFHGERKFGKDMITDTRIASDEDMTFVRYTLPVRKVTIGTTQYVESAFQATRGGKTFYYYTPYDYDPGYK
jgi:hypothetical protein